MKRIVYFFISFICILSFPATTAYAVGEFRADYDVSYVISPAGKATVTQNVTLTNNMSNLYAKQYSILIDSQKIHNVIATDSRGVIQPTITTKDNKTEILLSFNDVVVGLGKKLSFTLRFENDEVASKNGLIWEINIPGVSRDPDINSYTVSLSVPQSFGENSYLWPIPHENGTWTKDQLTNGGITAAYGQTQVFITKLSYHLTNPKTRPIRTEIALPPDTAFQKISIISISPKPETINLDQDGNWLAQYSLGPRQSLDITADISISLSISPRSEYAGPASLDTSLYTKATQYWPTTDGHIVSIAKEYKTPKQIYDYVVSTLSYDYNLVGQEPVRKGASQALQNPAHAICMEFTDTFIAIARAAGIPAREAVGFAYTTNAKLRPLSLVSDVLHAWPEYYDTEQNVWIPIDPTWANTTGGVNYFDKMDFNHIVFALHGAEDSYPYPAGSYRREGKTTKDVDVRFGTSAPNITDEKQQIGMEIHIPTRLVSGKTIEGELVISNESIVGIESLDVDVSVSPIQFFKTIPTTLLPPYGTINIPISFSIPTYTNIAKGKITVTVGGKTTTQNFVILPVIYQYFSLFALLIVAFVCIWYIFKKPYYGDKKDRSDNTPPQTGRVYIQK